MALVMREDQATDFTMHGSTFRSFVAPARGSDQLCAWQLVVAPHTVGTAHRVTHEEVLLVLAGGGRVKLDGSSSDIGEADVVRVPAGATLRIDTMSTGLRAWVVTSVGLQAVTADGDRIVPPWTR